ncbi:hypothetical protein [Qipengyuania flava]|uniref:hypothetical protein n=1 Tax=Qipengyuania flava TaxID=192812 RepID=UPI00273FB412|nr:hypothetical protein [Qipengyuania flava]
MAALLPVVLSSCGGATKLDEVSPDILAVEQNGETLAVKAQQSLVSDALALTQLGNLVGEIAEGIQADLPGADKDAKQLMLQISYETVDRLGNEGSIDAGTITFPMTDLRAANTDNLIGTMWLGLASNVAVSAGSDPLINHCADADNFAIDHVFCSKVAAALE